LEEAADAEEAVLASSRRVRAAFTRAAEVSTSVMRAYVPCAWQMLARSRPIPFRPLIKIESPTVTRLRRRAWSARATGLANTPVV
jgi:hypothetical protein